MSDSRPAAAPSGGTAPSAPDPDEVAAAVTACPSVVELSGGAIGEISSYLPGRRVAGVRIREDVVAIHVVARYPTPVAEVAEEVRRATAPLAGGRRIDVGVDDLVLPQEEPPADPTAPAGAAPSVPPMSPTAPAAPVPPAAP